MTAVTPNIEQFANPVKRARAEWNAARFTDAKQTALLTLARAKEAGDERLLALVAEFLAFYYHFRFGGLHDAVATDAEALRHAELNLRAQEQVHVSPDPALAKAHTFLAYALLRSSPNDGAYRVHARQAVELAGQCANQHEAAFAHIMATGVLHGFGTKLAREAIVRGVDLLARDANADRFELAWTYHLAGQLNLLTPPNVKLRPAAQAEATVDRELVGHHPFRLQMQSIAACSSGPAQRITILERASRRSARKYGEHHAQTLSLLCSLASAYEWQGESGEATRIYLSVLESQEQTLGRNHPALRPTLHRLAELQKKLEIRTCEAGVQRGRGGGRGAAS